MTDADFSKLSWSSVRPRTRYVHRCVPVEGQPGVFVDPGYLDGSLTLVFMWPGEASPLDRYLAAEESLMAAARSLG